MVFNTNEKNAKNKILDLQYNSYSNGFFKFYAVFLFVTSYCPDMQPNRIQMALPLYGSVFVFLHSLTQIIINCVMTNKMVMNERMSPYKNVHIIQSKF